MTNTAAEQDLVSAISRAQAASTPREIIDGVKEIVGREIAALNPDANVILTSYFNHSYMPDVVVEWPERGKVASRPVFIRNHLTPEVVEKEVDALSDRESVVLGLDRVEDADAVRGVPAVQRSRTLVSDVASVASLADAVVPSEESPLSQLVRSNILRGGRGLLAADEVQAVADVADLDFTGDTSTKLQIFKPLQQICSKRPQRRDWFEPWISCGLV